MKQLVLIIIALLIVASFYFYIVGLDLGNEYFSPKYRDDEQTAADVAVSGNSKISQSKKPKATRQSDQLQALPGKTEQTQALFGQTDEPMETQPAVIQGDWELIWVDEFDEPSLDMKKWINVDRKDNYNNELQYYTPNNSYVKDGFLYLTAKKEDKDGKEYTSGMVETRDKLLFCYGKIEARMKLPTGRGVFPAFWILSQNGDNEIDIMEMIGNQPTIFYGVNHYMNKGKMCRAFGTTANDTPEEFHVYVLEWDEDTLKWYIDDTLFFETNKGVPSVDMYIIFTLAIGGNWPGSPSNDTVFPCSMVIDYVKLFRHI
ncbi:MAG: glycoside hydrolase family 16 protein [Christensenellales bacterium]|jgi:beta-glucanase (GH16 family)